MEKESRVGRILKEWFPTIIFLVAMLLVTRFMFYLVIVPTGSMIPAIDEGSYLFALRVHNLEKDLERGDIVVFRSDEIGKTLVKRLVGLPGETVVIDTTGAVYINGALLDETYVKNPSPQSGEFQVPQESYFFIGDNRSGSYDARSWGNPYIGADKIDGKAVFTIFPFKNFGVLK